MPASPSVACAEPRCPYPAVRKGRCQRHRLPRDGYPPEWRGMSLALRRANPRCQRCGATGDLTVDHILPGSLAGGLRVLCRSCHATVGRKRAG